MMPEFLNELYAAILPIVLSLIAALLTRGMLSAAAVAKERWGIEIEATHRAALHSALMSGIRSALSRGMSGEAAVQAAVSHVAKSVPDALAHLEPKADVLDTLAKAKLLEAIEILPLQARLVSDSNEDAK